MVQTSWPVLVERLCQHAWALVVAASGSTTFGILWWGFGIVVSTWFCNRVANWYKLRKGTSIWLAIKGSLSGGIRDTAISACAVILLGVVAWLGAIPVAIYRDHVNKVSEIYALNKERNRIAGELHSRKNVIPQNDPALSNITGILQAFQGFRNGIGKRPCVIYITAPPDSTSIATEVGTFSALSGCTTNGPSDGRGDPDVDEMTKDGMVSNVIVVHVPRDSPPGLSLQENLGSRITTKLSYTRPQITKGHQLYDARSFGGKEYFVWLQFGTGVKWNSERYK